MKRLISEKLSAKSKLFELVNAIDGKKPSKESHPKGIIISSLEGSKCRVVISHTQSQTGNVWARVETFLPLESQSDPQST